jgi:hypothetical protein
MHTAISTASGRHKQSENGSDKGDSRYGFDSEEDDYEEMLIMGMIDEE